MSDVLIPVQVIMKLFTMVNELFGYWVEGNTLTDPSGERLIESLAAVIESSTYIFSLFLSIV